MRQFILWNIVLIIVVGFLGPWSSRETAHREPFEKSSQESLLEQRSGDKIDFVTERLLAFARTYVAIRRLLEKYEPPFRDNGESKQNLKLERETLAKVEQTLDVYGFTPDSFQRTFALVNADDELRNKALELIAAEREKLQS